MIALIKYLKDRVNTVFMEVAILYSGGKDSTMALKYALDKGWNVKALISIKPKDTSAYLWHFATVEWTRLSSEALGIPQIFIQSEKIGPDEEASELNKVFKELKVDAIVLGGVGLQSTQIKSVEKVAKKYDVKVIVPYKNYTSEQLIEEEVKAGFEIIITQVAADGLGPEWLGNVVNNSTLPRLKELSKKHGFDIDFEGGVADTFVCDGPIFKKRIVFKDKDTVWDSKTASGYLEVRSAELALK